MSLYKCKDCPREFTNEFSLRKHANDHIAANPGAYVCSFCGKQFKLSISLTAHMNSHMRKRQCELSSKKHTLETTVLQAHALGVVEQQRSEMDGLISELNQQILNEQQILEKIHKIKAEHSQISLPEIEVSEEENDMLQMTAEKSPEQISAIEEDIGPAKQLTPQRQRHIMVRQQQQNVATQETHPTSQTEQKITSRQRYNGKEILQSKSQTISRQQQHQVKPEIAQTSLSENPIASRLQNRGKQGLRLNQTRSSRQELVKQSYTCDICGKIFCNLRQREIHRTLHFIPSVLTIPKKSNMNQSLPQSQVFQEDRVLLTPQETEQTSAKQSSAEDNHAMIPGEQEAQQQREHLMLSRQEQRHMHYAENQTRHDQSHLVNVKEEIVPCDEQISQPGEQPTLQVKQEVQWTSEEMLQPLRRIKQEQRCTLNDHQSILHEEQSECQTQAALLSQIQMTLPLILECENEDAMISS